MRSLVIASEAKQSTYPLAARWIASSLSLLAMTRMMFDIRIGNERRALHLAVRVAGIALRLLAILLVGAVAAVKATGGGAEQAVMAGKVAGSAADHGALDAAL